MIFFVSLLFLFGAPLLILRSPEPVVENISGFVFTATGDYGANSFTAKNLKNISKQMPDLHLILGDLSYNQVVPETKWCKFVKDRLSGIPVALIAGNHESDGENGLIENFVSCLPNTITGVKGEYGKEYYFDYPTEKPLVRFILISPDLHFSDGRTFLYSGSLDHLQWLKKAVEEGHNKKIPWTIVGMHKTCITAGAKTCEIGEELINYLLAHNVDLILQGHAHNYERTHQLICVKMNIFDPACMGEENTSMEYKQGNGGVISIVGTGGASPQNIDLNDLEVPYFASLQDNLYGFLKLEVGEHKLIGTFHSLLGVKDEFMIVR